jgi:hypothetical protein
MFDALLERASGPMKLRLILQPTIATLLALRAGLKDARRGSPPFLWGAVTHAGRRLEILRQGWGDVGKVFVIATVLDCIYQFIVERRIRPVEALITATILAIVPYVLLRGPVTRIAGGR